jgi:KipI family sensor histidine kinase inhibitor
MKSDYRILQAGDSAVTVEFDERIDPAINARAIALAESLTAQPLEGVRDVVPTYRSVAVYFDPARTDLPRLITTLEREAVKPQPPVNADQPVVRIPVCYGGPFGPDLEGMAAIAGMSEEEFVGCHVAVRYRVFMLGYVPGFAYLGTVDSRIAVPRLKTPRVRVPRGAVGIAGTQTGIYPSETPGGWQILGRTPIRMFDLSRRQPFLLRPGNSVEFYRIAADEFEKTAEAERKAAA